MVNNKKELEIKKLKELYGQDFFNNLRKNNKELRYSSDKQILAWMEKWDAKLDEMELEEEQEGNREWVEPSDEEKEKARQELIKRGIDPDEELPF